jgi:hypothetical protein
MPPPMMTIFLPLCVMILNPASRKKSDCILAGRAPAKTSPDNTGLVRKTANPGWNS